MYWCDRREGHWTYSGDPSASTRDEVRHLIGDVVESEGKLSDEEIAYELATSSNTYVAAAACCEAIASRRADEISKSVNPSGVGQAISVTRDERHSHYLALAERYRKKAARYVTPKVGGIRYTSIDSNRDDTDLVQSRFERDQFDNL